MSKLIYIIMFSGNCHSVMLNEEDFKTLTATWTAKVKQYDFKVTDHKNQNPTTLILNPSRIESIEVLN